jgi:hypothetical protein
MEAVPRVIYGLTVDGSQGPAYRMKLGCVAIARACRAPIVLVRTHYRRGITLDTWDRTQIPLPFNRRLTLACGPYWIAPDADDAMCEAFRAHLENELLELAARVAVELDGDHGPHWGFPPGWTPQWAAERRGTPMARTISTPSIPRSGRIASRRCLAPRERSPLRPTDDDFPSRSQNRGPRLGHWRRLVHHPSERRDRAHASVLVERARRSTGDRPAAAPAPAPAAPAAPVAARVISPEQRTAMIEKLGATPGSLVWFATVPNNPRPRPIEGAPEGLRGRRLEVKGTSASASR